MADKQAAVTAIGELWSHLVKARALCPYTTKSMIGERHQGSPAWYAVRGAVYFVEHATPLTNEDIVELNQIAGFINRSFVIALAATLESHEIVPSSTTPKGEISGSRYVLLLKKLRNCFAHGQWEPNPGNEFYDPAKAIFDDLFPELADSPEGLPTSIDVVLERLKDETLRYIESC